jgi:hypothetical protein
LFEHCCGRVDADHLSTGGPRNWYRNSTVTNGEFHERSVRLTRQTDVELDNRGDLRRPCVVVLRHLLVEAHHADGNGHTPHLSDELCHGRSAARGTK